MAYAQMGDTNHDVHKIFCCDLVINRKAFLLSSVTLQKQSSDKSITGLTPGERQNPHFPTKTNGSSCLRSSFILHSSGCQQIYFHREKSIHQ